MTSSIRRWLGLCAWVLCAGAAQAQATEAAELRGARDAKLQQALESAVKGLGLGHALTQHDLALALVDVSDARRPKLAMLNGDTMMYAASMPKIGILFGALAEAENGGLALDADHLQAMNRMIRESSNSDATRVLKWVGEQRLLDWLQSPRFRFYDTKEGGGLWVGKGFGPEPAYRRDPIANLSHGATVYQVARLYTMLAAGTLFKPHTNALMLDILSRPGIHHKFVRALAGLPEVRVYRKSGTWKDFHADSALVEVGERRYVMVGIAHHADGGEWLVRLGRAMHALIVEDPVAGAHGARLPPNPARPG